MGATLITLRELPDRASDRVCVMWSQDSLLHLGYCLGARGSTASIDAVLSGQTTQLFDAVRGRGLDTAQKLDRGISAVAAAFAPTDWPAAVKTAINL